MDMREKREEEKDNSRSTIILLLAIGILIISAIGVSFATLQYAKKGIKSNTITTGKLSMNYSENSEGISITNANPMSDQAGMALVDVPNADGTYNTRNTFRFSISSTIVGTGKISYEITAIKKDLETLMLGNDDVKLYLSQVQPDGTEITVMEPKNYIPITTMTEAGSPVGSMVMYSGTMTTSQTTNYILKMWVDYDYDPNGPGGSFTVSVDVYGRGL